MNNNNNNNNNQIQQQQQQQVGVVVGGPSDDQQPSSPAAAAGQPTVTTTTTYNITVKSGLLIDDGWIPELEDPSDVVQEGFFVNQRRRKVHFGNDNDPSFGTTTTTTTTTSNAAGTPSGDDDGTTTTIEEVHVNMKEFHRAVLDQLNDMGITTTTTVIPLRSTPSFDGFLGAFFANWKDKSWEDVLEEYGMYDSYEEINRRLQELNGMRYVITTYDMTTLYLHDDKEEEAPRPTMDELLELMEFSAACGKEQPQTQLTIRTSNRAFNFQPGYLRKLSKALVRYYGKTLRELTLHLDFCGAVVPGAERYHFGRELSKMEQLRILKLQLITTPRDNDTCSNFVLPLIENPNNLLEELEVNLDTILDDECRSDNLSRFLQACNENCTANLRKITFFKSSRGKLNTNILATWYIPPLIQFVEALQPQTSSHIKHLCIPPFQRKETSKNKWLLIGAFKNNRTIEILEFDGRSSGKPSFIQIDEVKAFHYVLRNGNTTLKRLELFPSICWDTNKGTYMPFTMKQLLCRDNNNNNGSYEEMVFHRDWVIMLLQLNAGGRRSEQREGSSSSSFQHEAMMIKECWIDMIGNHSNRDDLSMIFYCLQQNPDLIKLIQKPIHFN